MTLAPVEIYEIYLVTLAEIGSSDDSIMIMIIVAISFEIFNFVQLIHSTDAPDEPPHSTALPVA